MEKRIQTCFLKKHYKGIPCKKLFYRLIFTISVPFIFCLYSCSTGLPTSDVKTNKNLFVEMESYIVNYPPGNDWQFEIDKIKNMVIFTRYNKIWTGAITGTTVIEVFEVPVISDTFKLGAKETAEHYMNNELRIMKEEGAKSGYELDTAFMSDKVLNDKKFYFMHYIISGGSRWEGNYFSLESTLALYFPPDYPEKRKFYGFIVSNSQDDTELYIFLKNCFKVK